MTIENYELKAMEAENECINMMLAASTNKHPALAEIIKIQVSAYQQFNDILLTTRRLLQDSLETEENTADKEAELHRQAATIWEKCANDIRRLLN